MPELIMVSGTIVTVVFTIERVISGITKSKLFLLPAPAGIFICRYMKPHTSSAKARQHL